MDGPARTGPASRLGASRDGLTRREVLRLVAAGGTAVAGVPVVAAVGRPAGRVAAARQGETVDVTLITAQDLPYPGIPSEEDQAASPSDKAYAEAIQPWL